MRTFNRRSFVAATAASALVTTGSQTAAFARQDNGATISVGSKNFTEQIIMGHTLALLLEQAGYTADRNLNLGGTAIAHEALVNGDIETYVEYTGTGLIPILGMDLPEREESGDSATPEAGAGMDQVYDIVAESYPQEFNVRWLEPWGYNNTYTMTVRRETAEEYNLQTMSDLESIAGDLTLGCDQEFPVRQDGLPAYEEAYGYTFGDVVSGDIGIMYSALTEGDVDVITNYTTDGRIAALDLVLLEDNRNFFPPYYAAPVVRQDVLDEHPDVADVLNQPAGLVDNELMASMNALVDEEGMNADEAARNLLQEIGLLDQAE